MDTNLRIPGPTPLPVSVREALARPMINHRGSEFKDLFKELTSDLKGIFQTQNDVYLLTCSGTGGLEAAVVNTLGPGDAVLAVCSGYFGDRFATVAEVAGADVTRLNVPWGQAAEPDDVRARLKARPGTKAVLVTHNETSTGITNDLKSIAEAVHSVGDEPPLLLVDAVSSLAAIDLQPDAWGCDVVVTCSQKALMAPPGLALLAASHRAWAAIDGRRCPSYYFDLKLYRKVAVVGETPATPAVADLMGLRAGVDLILAEGLTNVFARHRRLGDKMRQGAQELGLALFPDPRVASDTVTALVPPTDADGLRARLRERGVVVAGGQGSLKGRIIRVGHMGCVSDADIDGVLQAIKQCL